MKSELSKFVNAVSLNCTKFAKESNEAEDVRFAVSAVATPRNEFVPSVYATKILSFAVKAEEKVIVSPPAALMPVSAAAAVAYVPDSTITSALATTSPSDAR